MLLFLALMPGIARAQAGTRIGPAIGYEMGVPSGLNRNPGAVDWCRCSGDGTSYSHGLWLGAQLAGLFPGRVDIVQRLNAGYVLGSFTSEPYAANLGTGAQDGTARFVVRSREWYVADEILMAWRPDARWSVEIGPAIVFRAAGTFEQTEEVVQPEGGTFPLTGQASRTIAKGNTISGARLRLGVLGGVSSLLPIDSAVTLVPGLHARVDLEGVRLGLGLRALSVNVGVGLHFTVAPNVTPAPYRIDTIRTVDTMRLVELPNAAAHPAFGASLDIYAYDSTGARDQVFTVRRRAERMRRLHPFVPAIFFDANSAVLPAHYVTSTRAAAAGFSPDSLARLNPLDVHSHTLRVLGLRLREHPRARLTLVPTRIPGEAQGLPAARADVARAELISAWGIARGRIAVGRPVPADPAERFPSVRTVLRDDPDGAVAAPIVTEWEEQVIESPQIGVRPAFTGGKGMRAWQITVRQREREVLHCSSDGTQESHDLELGLSGGGRDREFPPLTAELTVEDSSGTLAVARDRLPVTLDTVVLPARNLRTVITIPVREDGIDRAMMNVVQAAVLPGDRVAVTYADPRARAAAEAIAAQLHRREPAAASSPAEPALIEHGAPGALETAVYGTPVTVTLDRPLIAVPR